MAVTVWNSADKTTGITLSSGDAVATCTTTSHEGVRATTSRDSSLGGKFVIGFRNVLLSTSPDPYDWIGIIQSTLTLGAADGNATEVIMTAEGKTYCNGDQSPIQFVFSGTHDFDLALDFDNMKFWYGMDGVWMSGGDPAANIGGRPIQVNSTYFPGCRLTNSGSTATMAPSPASLPSGFTGWDGVSDGIADGVMLEVDTSLISSDGRALGSLKTVTASLIVTSPSASALGSLITIGASVIAGAIGGGNAFTTDEDDGLVTATPTIVPNPVLSIHFDDDASLEAFSDLYNSNVVQCVVVITGR